MKLWISDVKSALGMSAGIILNRVIGARSATEAAISQSSTRASRAVGVCNTKRGSKTDRHLTVKANHCIQGRHFNVLQYMIHPTVLHLRTINDYVFISRFTMWQPYPRIWTPNIGSSHLSGVEER